MRFVLCQFSNSVINPNAGNADTLADRYYESLYTEKADFGYVRPEHFWELPLWIGEMTYAIDTQADVHLCIIDESMELPQFDDDAYNQTVYCFSVLDVTKKLVQDIFNKNPWHEYAFGGYIEFPRNFIKSLESPRVEWFGAIDDLCTHFGLKYSYGTDWSLFGGTECIPRLTMSYGCNHKCKFCTVPNGVTEVSESSIFQQAISLIPLKFKLIYLNDKTFGQAKNWHTIRKVYKEVRFRNEEFEGFIVQTSVATVLTANLEEWKRKQVKVIELGVETFNDRILKSLNKPQTEQMIRKALDRLRLYGFKVIVNIIAGLPTETAITYKKTYRFILNYMPMLFALNIYTLALYGDAELSNEIDGDGKGDSDELSDNKSFWSIEDKKNYDNFCNELYTLGIEIVEQ